MKISHLVLCGGLTLALLLSGCADSDTKTTSKKTVPRTTVVTTIIPGEVGTDQNVDGATVTLNGVYRSSITDVHNGQKTAMQFSSRLRFPTRPMPRFLPTSCKPVRFN